MLNIILKVYLIWKIISFAKEQNIRKILYTEKYLFNDEPIKTFGC